jgi:hypothetical protein
MILSSLNICSRTMEVNLRLSIILFCAIIIRIYINFDPELISPPLAAIATLLSLSHSTFASLN